MSTIPPHDLPLTSAARAGLPSGGAAVVEPAPKRPQAVKRIVLLGNPNTGKTTLFNRFSGLRHKTSNFPGTTLEGRTARIQTGDADATELVDLPGIYSLELDQAEAEICRAALVGQVALRGQPAREPDAICIVVDAMNLGRNLMLVGEALRRRLPAVVAINMIDLARRRGIRIDPTVLAAQLGCPVVCVSARTGEGMAELRLALGAPRIPSQTPPGDEAGLRAWANEFSVGVTQADSAARSTTGAIDDSLTDRADRVLTHPVLGVFLFALIMGGLFWALFSVAQYPMEWIDAAFGMLSSATERTLPDGFVRDLLAGGVITGVGATVIFLPQICLLFFLISLLEDTGYLARAAFVVDRLLRPFGLPGHAFVPLLSAHACALPGIMATRAIPDRRERIATILVAPFMTCSARLPVYVLLVGILFRERPLLAAAAFVGCYALGVAAGIFSALVARRTILRGRSRPMALELPTYKLPSLRTAALTAWDRGRIFLFQAGTNILAICIVLWWLGTFPQVAPPAEAAAMEQRAAQVEMADPVAAAELRDEASRLTHSHAKAHSFAGRLGRTIEPVLAPLGFDWQLSVGVLSSFAAREVFVSTLAIVVTGEEDAEDEGVLERLSGAKRTDGSPLFTRAVCWSLLIYYVLAMQCLPTLAVTAREAGGYRWALLQLLWMSGVAYVAALILYQALA